MLTMNRLTVIAAIVWISTCSMTHAQLPPPNPGAPFTAVETRTTTYADEVVIETATIARKSDGSTYWRLDLRTWNGVVNPKHFAPAAAIYDSRKHILTTLDLSANLYRLEKKTFAPQMYTPQIDARSFAAPADVRTVAAPLRTGLGVRKIDGVDAVGSATNYADGSSFEEWRSPTLFITLESTSDRISPKEKMTTAITKLTLGDPDPALFEVPGGFLPAPASKH